MKTETGGFPARGWKLWGVVLVRILTLPVVIYIPVLLLTALYQVLPSRPPWFVTVFSIALTARFAIAVWDSLLGTHRIIAGQMPPTLRPETQAVLPKGLNAALWIIMIGTGLLIFIVGTPLMMALKYEKAIASEAADILSAIKRSQGRFAAGHDAYITDMAGIRRLDLERRFQPCRGNGDACGLRYFSMGLGEGNGPCRPQYSVTLRRLVGDGLKRPPPAYDADGRGYAVHYEYCGDKVSFPSCEACERDLSGVFGQEPRR